MEPESIVKLYIDSSMWCARAQLLRHTIIRPLDWQKCGTIAYFASPVHRHQVAVASVAHTFSFNFSFVCIHDQDGAAGTWHFVASAAAVVVVVNVCLRHFWAQSTHRHTFRCVKKAFFLLSTLVAYATWKHGLPITFAKTNTHTHNRADVPSAKTTKAQRISREMCVCVKRLGSIEPVDPKKVTKKKPLKILVVDVLHLMWHTRVHGRCLRYGWLRYAVVR